MRTALILLESESQDPDTHRYALVAALELLS